MCCFELQPSPRIRPKLFRICQKTIRLGGKFRRCKNYQNGFFKTFFFATKEPTSLSGRSVFFAVCVCVLRFQGLAGGSNEVSRCTEFFPSGSLACEPTCTRPKLSPVRKKTCKLKNAEYTFKKTQELFNKGVSKQNKSKKAKRIPQASQQNGAVALLRMPR